MLNKLISTALLLCALTFGSLATASAATNDTSLFTGNELSLNVASTYTLDKGFTSEYDFNLQVGLSYYLTKFVGLEANLPLYQSHGVSVSEVSFGALGRYPLGKHLAPYVGAGANWNWEGSDWTYYAKAGLEVRLSKGWGVFGEYQYHIDKWDRWGDGAQVLAAGLRLQF